MAGSLCWFDAQLSFRTRSGQVITCTPLDITLDHGDGSPESGDPVVGLEARHAYVELGFRFLMRDILQIALAPADKRAWVGLFRTPPTPDDLKARLEPYRPAFMLDDPRHPAMQVQPSPERLAEMAKPKSRKARKAAETESEDEEDEGGAMPVTALLPDAPTSNVLAHNRDFFVKRDTVEAIGAGAILPVLYAHMVLFPPSGGGYFGLPHGADSLKFWIAGRTLWSSILANVLTQDHHVLAEGPWPAPCDASVFPWLSSSLSSLSLKKGAEEARRKVRRLDQHPAAISMPRRYRLGPLSPGTCDLTGIEGQSVSQYTRWPNGLQYEPAGWWAPHAAPVEVREWTGSGWAPRTAKPKGRTEDGEAPEEGADEPAGPLFLKARGPLRFDQWLELSLRDPPPPPEKPGKAKEWRGVQHPPVVSAFRAREAALADAAYSDQNSALSYQTDYRLEVVAAVPDGKALGGFSRGSLALWHVEDEAAGVVAGAVRDTLDAASRIADALGTAARDAAKHSDKTPALAGQLRDGLLTTLDARLVEATQSMFRAYEDTADRDAAQASVGRQLSGLVREMEREALGLFDVAFPFATLDKTALRIARARRKLTGLIGAIVREHMPQGAAQEQAGARTP